MRSPGHLFVLHGDLTNLVCDDIVMPADSQYRFTTAWRHIVRNGRPAQGTEWLQIAPRNGCDEYRSGAQLAVQLTEQEHAADWRRVWMLNSGANDTGALPSPEVLGHRVRKGLEEVAAAAS